MSSRSTRSSNNISNNDASLDNHHMNPARLAFLSTPAPAHEEVTESSSTEWEPTGANAFALPPRRSARNAGKSRRDDGLVLRGSKKDDDAGQSTAMMDFNFAKMAIGDLRSDAKPAKKTGRKTSKGKGGKGTQQVPKKTSQPTELVQVPDITSNSDINTSILYYLIEFKKINDLLLSSQARSILPLLHTHQSRQSVPSLISSAPYPSFFKAYTFLLFSLLLPSPESTLQQANKALAIFETTKPAFGPWQGLDAKDSERSLGLRWWVLASSAKRICEMEVEGVREAVKDEDEIFGEILESEEVAGRIVRGERGGIVGGRQMGGNRGKGMEEDGNLEEKVKVMRRDLKREVVWAYELSVNARHPREWEALNGGKEEVQVEKRRYDRGTEGMDVD